MNFEYAHMLHNVKRVSTRLQRLERINILSCRELNVLDGNLPLRR